LRHFAPKPHEVRVIHCPSCAHRFEASRKAQSLTCPRCTQPLQFKDLKVSRNVEGRLDTMGHIHIVNSSRMAGEVACGELTNSGRFDGEALVHGRIQLDPKSHTTGTLTAKSLVVEEGATLHGRARIGPSADATNPNEQKPPTAPGRSRVRIEPE